MKLFRSKDFYSITLAVVISLAVVAISASATTTISTSISTGGALDVSGLSTLTGGFISQASSTTSGALTASGYLGASSTAGFTGLPTFYAGFVSPASSTVSGALTAASYLAASSTAGFTGLPTFYGGFISTASSTVSSLIVSGVFQASSTALFGTTTQAIKIGNLSSTVPGSGVGLTASVTRALEVNADDKDAARAVGTQGIGVKSRLMIYADNSTEDWAVDGLTKYSAVAKDQNISAGVMGRWESTGATTLIGSGWGVAGVIGRIGTEAAVAISSGARAAALMAFGNNAIGNAFTGAGKYVGLWVLQSSTATMDPFDYGIEIQNSAATIGVKIGTATTDIELQGGDTITNSAASTTVITGALTANAYRVVNGTAISASGDQTKATLQGASFFPVAAGTGAGVAVGLVAMDAGDIGRELTFYQTSGTSAMTVVSGTGMTVISIAAGVGATEDVGDLIKCTITTTAKATCLTYGAD